MLCVACAARASAASGTATAAGLHLSSGAPRMRDERVVCLCVRVRVKGLSTALGSLGPGPDRGRTRLSFFGSRSLTKCETSFPYCPCPSKTPENQRTLDGAPAGSSALLFDGVIGGCTHARAPWRMPVWLYACCVSPKEHAPLGRCNAEWDFKAHTGQPFPLVHPCSHLHSLVQPQLERCNAMTRV